jgi:hypothetical protein
VKRESQLLSGADVGEGGILEQDYAALDGFGDQYQMIRPLTDRRTSLDKPTPWVASV